MRQSRARSHHAHKHGVNTRKLYGTKNRTEGGDYDQVYETVHDTAALSKAEHQEVDPDLPGGAQFYCAHCARYFIDENTLKVHIKSTPHKQMVKRLKKDLPWTTDDARGMGVDNGKPLGRSPKQQQQQQPSSTIPTTTTAAAASTQENAIVV